MGRELTTVPFDGLRITDIANAALGTFVLGFLVAAISIIWWAPDVGESVAGPAERVPRQGSDGLVQCDVAARAGVDLHRPGHLRRRAEGQSRSADSLPRPLRPTPTGTSWATLRPLRAPQDATHDLLADPHQHGSEPLSLRRN